MLFFTDPGQELQNKIQLPNNNCFKAISKLVRDNADFARREELLVLEKYMRLWEPLKFMKEDDVKKMINDKLKK